ncbi:hypothetical protein [Rhodococcus opacus]|uniref:hypothetical protein n=1 Tax=Rhodococcus opacus TaxID=37919 RepID=UPI00211E6085|nr:hypothetical protein [Rhodococcus opacus]
MRESVGDCSALLAEMDAFRQGFGQPALLTGALRSALLLIPLTNDDRLLTSTFGGLNWVCAFTSKQEYARYLLARDEQGGPCRFTPCSGGGCSTSSSRQFPARPGSSSTSPVPHRWPSRRQSRRWPDG